MLLKTVPVLPVVSITESVAFYTYQLGFSCISLGDYAILKCKEVEIYLVITNTKRSFEPGSCYIFTDDIECLYADCCGKGLIDKMGKLVSKPRGLMEFSIRDNNGNLIHFGQKK